MILYTPMQLEMVLDGMENIGAARQREVKIGRVSAVVEDTNYGEGKIVKILSTDPADYLRQEFMPGSTVYYI